MIKLALLAVVVTSADVRADNLLGARANWAEQLEPIEGHAFQKEDLQHLFERAAFGARSEDLTKWASASPQKVVRHFTRVSRRDASPDFEHSGVFDEGLDPFPPSRPATTRLAKSSGQALGIEVKPGGNRPIQPVVNQFFYWLRASRLGNRSSVLLVG